MTTTGTNEGSNMNISTAMTTTGKTKGSDMNTSIAMTTNGTTKGSEWNTPTTPFPNTNSTTPNGNFWEENKCYIIPSVSALAVVLLIALLVWYCKVNRRNSGKKQRQRKLSESSDLYQNSELIRYGQMGNFLETVVNQPLLLPPEIGTQSAGRPEAPEDVYEQPITANSLWLRHLEEIRRLPPPPPVFPTELENLQLYGENAYTTVLPDDTPLLTPGPMHKIRINQQLCEHREESGYVVPSSLLHNSVQQLVTEIDISSEPREIQLEGNGHQMRSRTVVTSQGPVQQCPDMSEGRSLAEGASGSSDARNDTERSNDTPGQIYRSSIQLILSPPTQHRSTQVCTSTPTVVVRIHTNHNSRYTKI